jgi:hypothetical protein
MSGENQIVFEDLRGVQEDEPITVDLDAETKDDGITRTPVDQAADADDGGDDDIQVGDIVPDDESGLGAADEDDASSHSEDDEYSKRVKARIAREQRAKRKERERADYWENQANEMAKDAYERDKASLKGTVEQADSAIARTLELLDSAIEDGKTKDQVRLTDELTNWKASKARAEADLENLSPDGNVRPFDGKVSSQAEKSVAPAAEWMSERGDWYKREGFEKATLLANRLDREVYKEGFDPNTPEYFKELDKRIKAKMPELYDDFADADVDDKPTPRKRPKRSPVAPVGGDENRQRSNRGSKVELREEDFANMRRFGLDTNDPEVLKEYARNKREADSGANR